MINAATKAASKAGKKELGVAWRINVASRALLAILGGYGLAALAAGSLGAALPLSPVQATLAASMLAFVLYALFAIWVFCAQSAIRAWVVAMALAIAPASHLLWRGLAS